MTNPDPKAAAAQETGGAPSEEDIWAELENEDGANPEPTDPPEDPAPDQGADDPAPDDGDEPDGGRESQDDPDFGPDDQGDPDESDDPASARKPDERRDADAQRGEGEPEGQQAGQELPEWFTNLPEEAQNEIRQTYQQSEQQRQQMAAMQQRYNAMQGRVVPTQQQLAQVAKERDELKRKIAAHENAPASLEELEQSKVFKAIADDFPEDAAEIKKLFSGVLANTLQSAEAKLEEGQRALQQDIQTRERRELQRLSQAYPDWQQRRNSPEFGMWFQHLPPEHQQRAQAMLSSPFAEENIAVLSAFDADLRAARGETTPDAPSGKPQGSQTSPQKPSNRRAPPSASPPSSGAGISGSRRTPTFKSDEDIFADVDEAEMEAFRRKGG